MNDNWWERDARAEDDQDDESSWYEADEVVAGDASRPVRGRGLGGDSTPSIRTKEEPAPTFDERAPRRSETFGPGPSESRPDPSAARSEPDPFADEGFGDLSKRRGQQFVRGATEVAASVPEALSILGRDITRQRHASVVEAIPALAEERKTLMGIIANNEDQSPQAVAASMRLKNVEGEILRAARMVSEDDVVMQTSVQDTGTFKLGDKLRDASTDTFGAPDERDRSFWAQVAEGGGNMVGMAAVSVLPGGVAAGAGLGSAMNSSQIFKEALEAGSSEEDAIYASRWGAAIGASEIVPITRALSPKGRLKRRVYWPAGKPIPAKLDNYVNRGTFEVRGFKGSKVVLWRDFTKAERTKMGEVLDARYTIAKTYAVMSKDLATGRFFKDIAENEEWSRKDPPEGERVDTNPVENSLRKRMWATPDLKWVKVPETKITKSDAYQYGALAGRYVRAEIWRDMEETRAMSSPNFYQKILTQWKLNKTARSPVVHMNNVMSNFMLMDMADVRMPDLIAGLRSMASGDLAYQEAATAGAFGADMVTQELRDNVLKPLMKELATEMRGDKGSLEGGLGTLGKMMDRIASGVGYLDQKMIAAYQMEDQVFRMATYIRRRQQGMGVNEAAVEARDQFLNYDIRAPWVNMARRTVLPFASYTYRAVPKIAQTIAERPWKIAKYIAIYQSLNMVAYAVAPSEYDEEEERKSLREEESGMMGFLGIPVSERLLRMPWLSNDNPVFLDVRRWIPAGDVFDTRGGDLPAPLHMGGPLITGMELYMNRSAFTGDDIVNQLTDTLGERLGKRAKFAYQSMVPSAPWVPGSWYFEKIKRAVWDDALEWGSNEPYDPLEAVLSSAGIKLKPKDVQLGYRSWQMDYDKQERELAFQRSSLKRQAQRNLIDRETYEKAFEKLMEKRARLRAAKAERFGN